MTPTTGPLASPSHPDAVPRVVVLGAGFGGLELTTVLSDALGNQVEVTLIDQHDSFVFGFSKLDLVFGHATPAAVRHRYRDIVKPGVTFRQETVTRIDPAGRTVTTDGGQYEADYLVVALGADYEIGSTPGLAEGGYEFYSVSGAERLRAVLPNFHRGRVVIGVASTPFKCPPAPSEAALMLHDYLERQGVRRDCEITLVHPFGIPIPPSPSASKALVEEFARRGIRFVPEHTVQRLDLARKVVVLDDDRDVPYDLFLGIPTHRAPTVVTESGLAPDGWVPVDPRTLATRFPHVYAVGDVAEIEVPKAGVFAEGQARVAAQSILAEIRGGAPAEPYGGEGSCYVEFGAGRVGRVDVAFLRESGPRGTFQAPSTQLRAEKREFGESRRRRWFGR